MARIESRALAAIAVAIALGAACSSDGEGGGGSSGASAQCDAACKVCPGDPCNDCAAAAEMYRDEFEEALFTCVSGASACVASLWISCSTSANDQAVRRPVDDEFRDACLEKKAACDAEGNGSFADDVCLLSNWYAESHVTQAKACLTQACVDADSCLQGLFD
jgi:hypothetical protein